MTRTHDADLCKEIKRLEKRVEQLERELRTHGPHAYPIYPYWPTPWQRRRWTDPYITWSTSGNTTYTIDTNTTTGTDITIG